MMFWVDMLLRSYTVVEPYNVLADRTVNFIIYFNNYVIVTDVIVSRPDVIEAHFIYYCIMEYDVIIEPCGCQGGHHGYGVMAAGICLYFYLGMSH